MSEQPKVSDDSEALTSPVKVHHGGKVGRPMDTKPPSLKRRSVSVYLSPREIKILSRECPRNLSKALQRLAFRKLNHK